MPSRRIEPEMIVAIAAVVVGMCALGVSLLQATIMRQQQEEMRVQRMAEVWPHVEFGTSYDGERFRLLAMNSGIGPARIESVRLLVDEAPVPDWAEFFDGLGAPGTFNYQQSQIGGRVLPPGEVLETLVVVDPQLANSLGANSDRVVAEICYCSVYDECWLYTQDLARGSQYAPVPICETPDGAFEQ